MSVVNKYPGAIRLKTNLPSPNSYFKVRTGSLLVKTIGVTSLRPVSFSAFSLFTNKKLLINGLPVFEITPSRGSQIHIKLDVTGTAGL